jgi:hypothetical protein
MKRALFYVSALNYLDAHNQAGPAHSRLKGPYSRRESKTIMVMPLSLAEASGGEDA